MGEFGSDVVGAREQRLVTGHRRGSGPVGIEGLARDAEVSCGIAGWLGRDGEQGLEGPEQALSVGLALARELSLLGEAGSDGVEGMATVEVVCSRVDQACEVRLAAKEGIRAIVNWEIQERLQVRENGGQGLGLKSGREAA